MSWSVVTLGAGLSGAALLTLGGVQGCAREQAPAPPPAATFVVESVELGDTCSRVGDYCVEVACTVRNTGSVDGGAEVEISLLRGRKPVLARIQKASSPVAGSAVLVEYFSQPARSDESRGVCDLR